LVDRPALAAGGGGDGGATAEGEPPSLSEPELRYEMPTLYVMLAPEDGRLPARLEIGLTVELNEAGAAELIRSHQPIITDGVWRAAARMQPSALATAAGMDQLRAELMRIISGAVGYGQVRDIYFREFLTRQPI
jgi:flagellar basal body-associated protein FliL